ncbi:MAG: hypothetical protein SGI83_10100 [Bacteroidota bacterium]|nr:hypothetical protein [Bacteroidota bacterium]
MRENEFEKRVQQKMEDFGFSPSDSVWTAVERRIRKEKKRRFILWWPLFFLLLGGGIAAGILLTSKKEKKEIITANKKTEKTIQSSLEKTNVPEQVNNSIIIQNPDTATNKNTAIIVKHTSDEIKIISQNAQPPSKFSKQIKENKATVLVGKKNNTENSNQDIAAADKQNNSQKHEPPVTAIVTSKPTTPLKDLVKTNDIAVVTKQAIVENKNLPEQVPQPADSVSKKETTITADKKKKKWDWGIHFSFGRSIIGQGLSFGGQRFYFDALASQSSSPPGLFSNSSSPVRSSFSWSTGVYFKKAISKKLDFNMGLGYAYLSAKINAGSRVDSTRLINNYYSQGLTVNNFYRSAGNSSYTYGFHFISLTADLSWRIITGKKINIYWENGFSYTAMLGSSMLHYDTNLQGYYKDNSLLAKNQLAFSTGFSIPVSKRLGVSPFVSYNLTPVLKNSDTLHFTNYGIRIRFLLNKK